MRRRYRLIRGIAQAWLGGRQQVEVGQQEEPGGDDEGEGQGGDAEGRKQHVERALGHHGEYGAEQRVQNDPAAFGLVKGRAQADGRQHGAELEQAVDDVAGCRRPGTWPSRWAATDPAPGEHGGRDGAAREPDEEQDAG